MSAPYTNRMKKKKTSQGKFDFTTTKKQLLNNFKK